MGPFPGQGDIPWKEIPLYDVRVGPSKKYAKLLCKLLLCLHSRVIV